MQGHGNRVDVLGLVRLIRFWRFGIFILVFSQVVRIHGWIKGRRGENRGLAMSRKGDSQAVTVHGMRRLAM